MYSRGALKIMLLHVDVYMFMVVYRSTANGWILIFTSVKQLLLMSTPFNITLEGLSILCDIKWNRSVVWLYPVGAGRRQRIPWHKAMWY